MPALALTLLLAALPVRLNLCAQPVPHHFGGIAALPDQTITLSLGGSVLNMFNLSGMISNQFMQMFDLYAVEASTDLMDWTPLALLLRTNNDPNRLIVQDTNAADLSQRFYRTGTNHLLTVLYDATNVQLNPAGLQKPFLVALGENNAYYTQDLWLFSMGK